jgi:hypothetical protein
MKINFVLGTLYQRKVVVSIINNISTLIPLPDHIVVEFKSMGLSSYGETTVDYQRARKKIVLNQDLTAKELFYPTIHELVHVSQIHTGKLSASRTGVFVWENKTYQVDPAKMSYQDYQKLPWELDAHEQQWLLGKKLLENQ